MRPIFLAAVVVAASIAPSAWAAGTNRDRADALFREGRASAQAGDYAGACTKFAESERLDPSPGTVLNLGDCSEHLGKWLAARDHFRDAILKLPANDPRIAPAKERLSALEPRIPHVTVTLAPGAPAGTRVEIDDRVLGDGELGSAVPLDPGEHKIVVTAPGRPDNRRALVLAESTSESLALAAGEAQAPVPDVGAAKPGSGGDSLRTAGWVIGGVGVAGFVLAGVSGVVLMNEKSAVESGCHPKANCSQDALDAISANKTWLVVNTAAWIVGAAGVAAGVYLVLTHPGAKPGARVGAALLPGGGGATATVPF